MSGWAVLHRIGMRMGASRFATRPTWILTGELLMQCFSDLSVGYYSPIRSGNVYYACPQGTFADGIGFTSCKYVTAGTYGPLTAAVSNTFSCSTSFFAGSATCGAGKTVKSSTPICAVPLFDFDFFTLKLSEVVVDLVKRTTAQLVSMSQRVRYY